MAVNHFEACPYLNLRDVERILFWENVGTITPDLTCVGRNDWSISSNVIKSSTKMFINMFLVGTSNEQTTKEFFCADRGIYDHTLSFGRPESGNNSLQIP
jgi:hypothetical protein